MFPLSELEAKCYYAGLPSAPVLVARTGTTPWYEPTGPEAYLVRQELHPVGDHMLEEIWEDKLALKIHALLDSMEVKWTSTDIVRIGDAGESSASAPVILWIGVMHASLSRNDGAVVASKCREILVQYDIADVNVEIRESVVTRSGGPKLLESSYFDSIVDVREPLTPTLGLPICAQSTPWADGTGGFFITEGGNTNRLLLVTTRHVIFTPDKNKNKPFKHENDSRRRHNVMLFGDGAFKKYLESIEVEIRGKTFLVQYQEQRIASVEGRDDEKATAKRRDAQAKLDRASEAMEELNTFYHNVSTHWAASESRVLGHVILSPPINVGVGSECYTEDWAVIEVDASKVDASNFHGNAIDLGTQIPLGELTHMLNPNLRRDHSSTYPWDRLLKLTGIIPDQEMRHVPDQNDDPCLMVIKRGNTSGLTVGRANNIFSYARYYDGDEAQTSKEWAILPFNLKSGAFSEKGDSGSVIVDGLGRIGGLLTGGAGRTHSMDITYATPISFILKRMQDNGLHMPNLNPVLAANTRSPD